MLTTALLPTSDIHRFFYIVQPFKHWIRFPHGTDIPSPVWRYLQQVLGEDFEKLSDFDFLMRSPNCPAELEYNQFIAYLNAMLLALSFEIRQYDALTVPFMQDRPDKKTYLLCYVELFRYRLDIRYKCTSVFVEKIKENGLSAEGKKALLHAIADVFAASDEDMAMFVGHFEDKQSYFSENAPAHALVSVYQSYIETRLYKHSIADVPVPAGKAMNFQVDEVLALAKAEGVKEDSRDTDLTLMYLETRVNYHFKGDVKKGIDGLVACLAYLEAHRPEFQSCQLDSLKMSFIMQLFSFMSEKIIADKSLKDGVAVKRWLDVALQAKPILVFAADGQCKKLLGKLLPGIEAYFLYLVHKANFVKLPDCEALGREVLGLSPYLSLVGELNKIVKDGRVGLWLEKNKKELSELFNKIKLKAVQMKAKAENETKRLKELEIKTAEYNASFDDILKQFQETVKAKLKTRKVKNSSQPEPSQPGSELPEKMQEPVVVREPTVSEACVAYFQAFPEATGQMFLAMQSDENKPEAMLYIGDQAMFDGCVQDALEWYEEAIIAFEQQNGLNPEIKESIEMVLTITREFLDSELARVVEAQKTMDASLYHKIINWGLDACRQAKCEPHVLAMKDKESAKIVYTAGWNEFLRRGETNKKLGRGVSSETKKKRRLKADQHMFRECLKKTDVLMDKVNPPALVGEEAFPSLQRSHHVTLYKPKPKAQPKAGQQHASARRKAKH